MFQGVGSSGPGLQLNATSYGTGAFIRVTIQILRDQGYNVNSGMCNRIWNQWSGALKGQNDPAEYFNGQIFERTRCRWASGSELSCFNVPMLEPKSGNLRVKTIMLIDLTESIERMETVWSDYPLIIRECPVIIREKRLGPSDQTNVHWSAIVCVPK